MMQEIEPRYDPAAIIDVLPDPQVARQELLTALRKKVTETRQTRGTVSRPEDTYGLIRSLHPIFETLEGYAEAFTAAKRLAREELEEELITAVGEEDGIPISSMSVPDLDGSTIKIGKLVVNAYDIDEDILTQIVAIETATACVESLEEEFWKHDDSRAVDLLARVIQTALDKYKTLGKFEPQITRVKGYAATLSHHGQDQLAGSLGTAVRKKPVYKGVTAKREN